MGLLIDPISKLQANTMRIFWQAVRRITNEILGVKGLNQIPNWLSSNPDLFANSDIILRLLSTHNFEEVHLQIT